MKKYDVLVIGTGGGTKLVNPVAKLGLKVAVVEKGRLGGTCLNRGCIPSKMLIHPANVATIIKDTKKFDIDASFNDVNFGKITRRITKTVFGDSDAIENFYKNTKKFDFYQGEGKFVSDKVVEVNGEHITADKIFIAVGARPMIPPIDGLKGTPFMTSTEALRETKQPEKLIVIGGGYIGCELGYAYSALGTKVEFVVRSQLLRREDSEVKEEFTRVFSEHQKVHLGWSTKKVSYQDKMFSVVIEDKSGKTKTLKADGLLVATGVTINTDTLGLENTSIKVDKRGFVQVNKHMETDVKGVYAIGDCVGNYMFRHSVNFEGEFLFRTLFVEKKPQAIKYPPVPHAVFTHPEIAGVGLTEDECKEQGITYYVGKNPYIKSGMGMARLSDHGFVKVIFDAETDKLIGAHAIGEEASNMIHQFIYAMTFNAKREDLLKMIYIHPALNEIARNAVRKAIKK